MGCCSIEIPRIISDFTSGMNRDFGSRELWGAKGGRPVMVVCQKSKAGFLQILKLVVPDRYDFDRAL